MERASRGLKKEATSEISEEENCDETSLGLDDISGQCEAKPLILPELNEGTYTSFDNVLSWYLGN